MKRRNGTRGQAMIVVLMIGLVLGILASSVFRFQSGQIHLLSKSAKDYLSLCAAEAGVNCVLAEAQANPQFVTHGDIYRPPAGWDSPAKHRPYLLGPVSGLELDQPGRGLYSGRLTLEKTRGVSEFKVRMKLLPAKNSVETQTVDESHRYFVLESFGRADDTCRKITAVLERTVPGSFLMYDGEVLDLGGQGPYRLTPGIVDRGRLYGHELVLLTKRGMFDSGIEGREVEKISTPGHLSVKYDARIAFRNGQEGRLRPETDSAHQHEFESFPEKRGGDVIGRFVVDGFHGGKSEKLPPLNAEYYKSATDPRPEILTQGAHYKGFAESKWRNPLRPGEVVYDIDFGWDYDKRDGKELIYSTVPLRIWGCPRSKALTIFCEKDVYIAGDFNANPRSPQNYPIAGGYKNYIDKPENGTDKNGVAILSLGRIWYDYSNPMLFLRNEMTTWLDYEIAKRLLKPEDRDKSDLKLMPLVFLYREHAGSNHRMPLTALQFPVIATLLALPKTDPPTAAASQLLAVAHRDLGDLREFFNPSTKPEEYKNRFCIKSFTTRQAINFRVAETCFLNPLGMLPGMRDNLIDDILDQAYEESLEVPSDPTLAAWNVADRLFKVAVSHPKTAFRIPEMTVNALLIDSAKLNARWDPGNGATKVENEIGNILSPHTRSLPFIGPDTRMLLRHYGGTIHLRTLPAEGYLDGSLRADQSIVRRNVWDRTNLDGDKYLPPYLPGGFSLCGWSDDACTIADYQNVK